MSLVIKGITSANTIDACINMKIKQFSFDLRPKSFNFTQAYNINEIIKKYPFQNFSLIFENEKNYVIEGLIEDIAKNTNKLSLEFSGFEKLEDLEKLKKNYILHYRDHHKLKDYRNCKFLKTIIFSHDDLKIFHKNNELFGFLQLFDSFNEDIQFELAIDWDTDIIFSLFDYINISRVSLEINNKVEKSYQNVDHELMRTQLKYFNDLFFKEEQ